MNLLQTGFRWLMQCVHEAQARAYVQEHKTPLYMLHLQPPMQPHLTPPRSLCLHQPMPVHGPQLITHEGKGGVEEGGARQAACIHLSAGEGRHKSCDMTDEGRGTCMHACRRGRADDCIGQGQSGIHHASSTALYHLSQASDPIIYMVQVCLRDQLMQAHAAATCCPRHECNVSCHVMSCGCGSHACLPACTVITAPGQMQAPYKDASRCATCICRTHTCTVVHL